MKEFIRTNKLITIFFVLSVAIIVICHLCVISYTIYSLLYQLSIGYIINFIFYITQIYLPNRKKDYSAKQCVNIRIDKIIKNMQNSIFELSKLYNPNHSSTANYSNDDLKQLMKLNFSDNTNILNIATNTYFSVHDWLKHCIIETEHEIDNLYRYYPNYISAKLTETLEKIINSNYHNIMKFFLMAKNSVNFSNSNDYFFIDYYNLINDLKMIQESDYKN